MGDAYGSGSGGGYSDYSQPPPSYAYQSTGYGSGQDGYGQQSQSAYGQNQSSDGGWDQQRGGRSTSGGSYRGAQGGYNRGRGYGSSQSGGYGDGQGSGNYGGGMNRGYGGGQRGSFGKGNGSVTQQDTVFISQMDPSCTEEDIAEYFGSIGIIKMDRRTNKKKVWLYKDKITGMSKGEATVTYDDCNAAQSAISWFNGKDFRGSIIKVQMATKKDNWSSGSGRGGFGDGGRRSGGGDFGDAGRGGERVARGRGGGGGGNRDRESRDGDWKCPNSECANANFGWRVNCNRCGLPKPAAIGDGGDESRGEAGRGRYSSSPRGERGFRGSDRGFGRGRGSDRGRGFGGSRGGGGRGRGDGGRGSGGRDRGSRPKSY